MSTKSYWQRFERQRISRRRVLAATGIGAAGLAVAAACGDGGEGGEPQPTGDGSGAPNYGGRFIYSITGDWATIDPVTSAGFAPGIFPRIYNCLLDRSRLQPDFFYFDLAEEVEQPDEETYLFKIRPGVTIAPNTLGIEERDLDGGDVTSYFDRIAQEDDAIAASFTREWLQSVTVTADQNVELKTNGPYAYTLLRIGAPLGGCIPPREFFEQGIDIKAQGVGAGPFGTIKAGSFSESGGIIVQRNPNYYRTAANGDQLAYLDEVEAVRIDDRLPRRLAFLDEQIHSYGAEDREETNGLLADVPDALVTEVPANTYISFTMNPEKDPWTDERIRKAALFALNRQEFVDLVVGPDGGRPNGLVHWPLGDFALSPEELEELQPYDPARSRQLIKDATGEDTIDIKVMYPSSDIEFHDKHLPIFLKQMEEAGFNVQEDLQDFGSWYGNYQDLNYDASLSLNQIYETPEVSLNWHSAAGPQGDRNFATGIGGLFPEIEEAITASKIQTNADDHIAAVLDAQRLIYDKGPAFLPIMSWTAFTLFHSFVKNVPQGLGATGLYLTNEMWLDQGV
ncbi:MAG: ABC transporter substrate-binding protein [Chloroflexi bacterium]|nr:ABC transporter substrate-binding protein [Chloroflexota bacterium]